MALEKDQKGFLLFMGTISVAVVVLFLAVQKSDDGGSAPRKPSKLLVCIVRETANERSITPEQQVFMDSIVIRKYLQEHALEIKDNDGNLTHGYRFLDYDPSQPDRDKNLPPAFRKLIDEKIKNLSTTEYPYIYISNGYNDGIEGSLYEDFDSNKTLLVSWGGP